MDDLIMWKPGDVAWYKFAVHADGFAWDAVFKSLLASDALEAFVKQVNTCLLLILCHITAQGIVGVYGRTLLVKFNQAKCTTIKHVEAAVLVQGLVTAATSFFKNTHCDENAYGGIGMAIPAILTFLCK